MCRTGSYCLQIDEPGCSNLQEGQMAYHMLPKCKDIITILNGSFENVSWKFKFFSPQSYRLNGTLDLWIPQPYNDNFKTR